MADSAVFVQTKLYLCPVVPAAGLRNWKVCQWFLAEASCMTGATVPVCSGSAVNVIRVMFSATFLHSHSKASTSKGHKNPADGSIQGPCSAPAQTL